MAIASITPITSIGHSAPAKTATHPWVSNCGLRGSDNLLAATKVPIVVTSHPHKYTFTNILISPFLHQLDHHSVPPDAEPW